jgi:hypothetical protein
MVLSRLRRIRLAAAILIVCVVGATGFPGVLHNGDDDPFCDRPLTAEASGPSIRAEGGLEPTVAHCAVCHWLQSLRTIEAQATATVLNPSEAAVYVADSSQRPARVTYQPILARGPPA